MIKPGPRFADWSVKYSILPDTMNNRGRRCTIAACKGELSTEFRQDKINWGKRRAWTIVGWNTDFVWLTYNDDPDPCLFQLSHNEVTLTDLY
jgi:hypothetical protein